MVQHGDGRWTVPIGDRAVGGARGSLFGGVGLAAGVAAMELDTGRRAVWVTAQYVSTLYGPSEMTLRVDTPAVGRTASQCRVQGVHGDAEIINALGTVGERPEQLRGGWEQFPDALSPADSFAPERAFDKPSLHDYLEVRVAKGMYGFTGSGEPSVDHRSLVWARLAGVKVDAAALAIIADVSPAVVGNAVGRQTNLSSLDNTIRYADPAPVDADWVLCDSRVEFIGNGFAHTSCLMWTEAGQLVATASQSMTLLAI